jgi:phage antirepressor YoqD-like protein
MNTIVAPSNTVAMSSREIADLTGKQHQHVMRDTKRMLGDLGFDASTFGRIYLDSVNRQKTEYVLGQDLVITLLAGYSAPLRFRVVTRLQELENVSRQAVTLPDFSNPAVSARAWAEQFELQQAAQQALALAAPKVAFVDQYIEASGSMGFRQVAKLLNANERQFRQMLLDKGAMYYLGGVLTPYSQHQDAARFEVKTGTSETSGHAFSQARFTTKGVQWVAGLWSTYQMEISN